MPNEVQKALLDFRRNLADAVFLREHFYTVDNSRFVGSTHTYLVRLGLTPQPRKVLETFGSELPSWLNEQLRATLARKIFDTLPGEFLTLIKVPTSVKAEDAGQECRSRGEQAIRRRLPGSIPYATYHFELNRLLQGFDPSFDVPPSEEEFAALFAHLNRNTMTKARSRYPEVWDEQRGHYVFDTRGADFAKTFALELRARGLLQRQSRFVDLGSGIGTMLAAVNHYTSAHATGIERHRGLMQMAQAMIRRLTRKGLVDPIRIAFKAGNAFDPEIVDLSQYDLFYVYSPIGKWEINIDDVIEHMKVGAVVVVNRSPRRNATSAERIGDVAGLVAFRKIAT